MVDREKTIRGLYQHCEGSMFDRCGECPYYDVEDYFQCRDELLHDALELLKDQEPVVPYVDSEGITINCGNCGETVGYYPAGSSIPDKKCVYCPECGRKVKWDD